MTEFADRDLGGARVERVVLRDATLMQVRVDGARMRQVDLGDVEIRGGALRRTRLIGLELQDVEITGDLENVTVNGVDIAPLVEAELNARTPDRARMRPDDADGFRQAWAILERRWEATVDRARSLPPEALHVGVGGEWSFIQTLRHLNFASAAWVARMILGDPSPWHPLDLPWDEAPGWDGIPWDREARPALEEVLVVRRARQAMVRGVLESLTDDRLASSVSCREPGWPQLDAVSVEECLRIVLNEEWEHRRYAERDLAVLEASSTT
jgi:hypothetical protein